MADLTALLDVDHFWGSDIALSPTGDLSRAVRDLRSNERVLRRLMTNPGEVILHPEYGAGLRKVVGSLTEPSEIEAIIRNQMQLEESVAQTPAPVITARAIPNGISVSVQYVALPDRQPVPLSFDITV